MAAEEMWTYDSQKFLGGDFSQSISSQELFGDSLLGLPLPSTPEVCEGMVMLEDQKDFPLNDSYNDSPGFTELSAGLSDSCKDLTSLDTQDVAKMLGNPSPMKSQLVGRRMGSNVLKQTTPAKSVDKRGLFREDEKVTLVDWGGEYKFEVTPAAEAGKKSSKSNYVFAPEKKKLYCKRDFNVPFEFRMDFDSYSFTDYKIRASLAFDDTSSMESPVIRCRNHKEIEQNIIEAGNEEQEKRVEHALIPADMKNARFFQCPTTSRCFVVTPLSLPEPGTNFVKLSYKFTCLNTCMKTSGTEAPGMAIIFCLFDPQEELVGRRVISLRVCTAPFRDRTRDSEKVPGEGRKRKSAEAGDASTAAKNRRTVTVPRHDELSSQETIYEDHDLHSQIKLKPLMTRVKALFDDGKKPHLGSSVAYQLLAKNAYQSLNMLVTFCDQADAMRCEKAVDGQQEGKSPDNGFSEN